MTRDYIDLERQVEALLEAIDTVVPTQIEGMHPSLTHLHLMAQSMRHYLEAQRS